MTGPLLAHTATKLADARARVVVCGSHGGAYAGSLAVTARLRAIALNDAGIGRDRAGIAGLGVCQAAGIPAVALSHASCRIGNAEDALARGVVSAHNAAAAALGAAVGMGAREAARRLEGASTSDHAVCEKREEARTERTLGTYRLVVADSAALVGPADAGAIVITGSHGGLVGDDPESAGRAAAAFFAFNDAGVGLDAAGISRLPVLQARGIAAVCVDCHSARIGVARSTLEDGIVSHANDRAAALGARAGERLRSIVERLAGAPFVDAPADARHLLQQRGSG